MNEMLLRILPDAAMMLTSCSNNVILILWSGPTLGLIINTSLSEAIFF